jgi:hypothetical protein
MRKGVVFVVALAVMTMLIGTGCTDKKEAKSDTLAVITDTIDTTSVDSLEEIIAETPMPKAADELFDDFFFNFASNKQLQRNRIVFPLTVKTGEESHQVQRQEWKMEKFFRTQGYFTLIFDNTKQMKLVKDTSINKVTVEKIRLGNGTVEQFQFERKNGQWVLAEIDNISYANTGNASFLTFLDKFLSDESSQQQSIENPLPYYGPDPQGEEENKCVNTEIAASEWRDFLPELPTEVLYNIDYGQTNASSNQKILMFKGIANGLETQLVFKKNGNDWRLVKLNAQ